MSCIRFNTPAQRRQLAASAPAMRTAAEVAEHYRSPEMTDGKINRLRLLAENANPKIRESVAGSRHVPADVVAKLLRDPDDGVRGCLARNETIDCDVLRDLASDAAESVRGWVALNFFVPADAMDALAVDPSPVVRGLVAWKSSLQQSSLQQLVEA